MPLLLVGITAQSDTNSITDFQPALRMKCHVSKNTSHSPNSVLLPNLLMAVTGNVKKRLAENMVDSLWEKKTEKVHHQPPSSSSTQNTQNKSQKKQFVLCESSSSAHNSEKRMLDLSDKLSKDSKLTVTE